ncbi:MAG: polyprenyl synthetase family protein [Spirochaetia bacterium]
MYSKRILMQDFFTFQKKNIIGLLGTFLEQKREDLKMVHSLGSDVCARLKAFVSRGKMLRGGLVSLSSLLFQESFPAGVVQAGATLELVQAGLLIHDDIMDGDLERRGEQSLFYTYAKQAEEQHLRRAFHVGESLGVCAGDMAFFLAYELLSEPGIPEDKQVTLVSLLSRELNYVAAAQMLDMYRGAQGTPVLTEEDILRLYTYKTGRYTFSLPLMFGAVLSGSSEELQHTLADIGEKIGIIFQIKDDELGLFGDSTHTGKPIGSDIKEGKKNLYYYYLFHDDQYQEREEVRVLYSTPRIGEAEISRIRSLVLDLGIQEKINKKTGELAEQAKALIRDLPHTRAEGRSLLIDLLKYNLERTS